MESYFDGVLKLLRWIPLGVKQEIWPIIVLFALLLAACVVVYLADRGHFGELSAFWGRKGGAIGRWLLAFMATYVFALLLNLGRPIAMANEAAGSRAELVRVDQGDYGALSQTAPYVAFFFDQTFTKSYALPQAIADHIAKDPTQSLESIFPESSEGYDKVSNRLVRKGQSLVLVRDVTRRQEQRFAFDAAKIALNLDPTPSRTNNAFAVRFDAIYDFTNPSPTNQEVRFRITLPEAGYQIEEIKIKIDGQMITKADDQGTYEWLGTMAPNQHSQAEIHYRTKASGAVNLDVAETLRPVKDFELEVQTPLDLRFQKHSLMPTQRSPGVYRWSLQNAAYHQSIAIAAPASSANEETLSKLYSSFAPLLLVFVVLLTLRPYRPSSYRALAASAGLALAFAVPMAGAADFSAVQAIETAAILSLVVPVFLGGAKTLAPSLLVAGLIFSFLAEGTRAFAMLCLLGVFVAYTVFVYKRSATA
jgi:hypothetical protein